MMSFKVDSCLFEACPESRTQSRQRARRGLCAGITTSGPNNTIAMDCPTLSTKSLFSESAEKRRMVRILMSCQRTKIPAINAGTWFLQTRLADEQFRHFSGCKKVEAVSRARVTPLSVALRKRQTTDSPAIVSMFVLKFDMADSVCDHDQLQSQVWPLASLPALLFEYSPLLPV